MNMTSTFIQPPVHMPMQQPPYWASPPGPNPAGSVPVNVTYAAAAGIQVLYFYF